ncbi:MAG: hypothetical protein KDM64_17240 [Verrucomicrobiae bacterium]|nr:hypothetical protein [Verrucomicrobiae bacterium]
MDQLMAWVDALETLLSASHATATDLLSAEVNDLTPTDTRCLPPTCRHR